MGEDLILIIDGAWDSEDEGEIDGDDFQAKRSCEEEPEEHEPPSLYSLYPPAYIYDYPDSQMG